ncbi:diguanylate cyclase domain-containing protein [Tuwongella immobilis]|uniref:diguanylate cyclase n=1 Tax=Tuwongella immobilis TaxID=692036 RepID=A0A6C2YM15_9BACT|nr:diguanylate cyclase [Tuwongella immobilis]VIP02269.1 diguanylate cyclase : Response regulator receiver protein OS=gamma proteobacterium HTCC5015 GN=GP5015_959 PE=4 SV=1: GGDEF [Tuwongella immobilis]VTS00893.1 diguanylate cyclase : Response regulator receiver protein OS=gamma proteobacterium HTCC5015 GN=GP5015_959 PE=4 SV=1: GGDEF [Tuwongella immobilis]
MLEIDIPVLLVLQSPPLTQQLHRHLIDLGIEPTLIRSVATLEASLDELHQSPEAIILFDAMLPGAQEDLLGRYTAVAPRTCRVVVLRREDSHHSTRSFLQAGADGVISETGLTVTGLESLLEHAWFTRNLRLELHQVRSEIEHARAQLRLISTTDTQTGLSHGRYFEERLAEDWRRAAPVGGLISLIGIAIDGFDSWVSRTPPMILEEFLQTLARRLQNSIRRAGDLPARLGRDRFVVLLPRADQRVLQAVLQRLAQKIARDRLLAPPGCEWPTVTLAGITEMAHRDGVPTNLIVTIGNALTQGQRQGGDRIVTLEPTP